MPILPLLITLTSLAGRPIELHAGNRALPRKLRGLPIGILAQHHPNPCYPVKEGGKYVWRHDTTVQSLAGDLVIVEYGAYIYTDAGWILRATMSTDEFAKTYRCPGGRLRKGRVYADPDNARYGDKPTAGDALWFFLAKDSKGRMFKGIELVETESLAKDSIRGSLSGEGPARE